METKADILIKKKSYTLTLCFLRQDLLFSDSERTPECLPHSTASAPIPTVAVNLITLSSRTR